ncbi:hypothetical protein MA16_Dca007483 [Dendrobium catenatum]|uniref:Uncharacterized protein n=1 Tax=Dendrobium catenatum TaxID=906689 RepID=A0A2I0WB87_9ASPA|nr:hypothetical protein MA16_Dca007483 [Dendrobium catenatum]
MKWGSSVQNLSQEQLIQIRLLFSLNENRLVSKSSRDNFGSSEEEEEPAPANEPNYQDLVQRFGRLETHVDQRIDQIETHLQQQDTQYNQDMGFIREQMNDISSNMLMISNYFNFFNAQPPPPPDQGPSE